MLPDAVVAIVPDGKRSDLLSAIHGAGMGYLTRVATSDRGELLPQLQRAGLPISQAPWLDQAEQVLMVNAGGRAMATATLLLKHGAISVWIVNTLGAWMKVDDMIVANVQTQPTTPTHVHRDIPGRTATTRQPPAPTDAETPPGPPE